MTIFEGEHLLPGQLGHFFVVLALISSLVSLISFFIASRAQNAEEKMTWLKYAQSIFYINSTSILVVFSIIFYICFNHYYEYMYAYKHASKELEYKFLLACIWEGQEGSFLLWSIWNAVLGSLICLKFKKENTIIWQAPVMSVISLAQFF